MDCFSTMFRLIVFFSSSGLFSCLFDPWLQLLLKLGAIFVSCAGWQNFDLALRTMLCVPLHSIVRRAEFRSCIISMLLIPNFLITVCKVSIVCLQVLSPSVVQNRPRPLHLMYTSLNTLCTWSVFYQISGLGYTSTVMAIIYLPVDCCNVLKQCL